MMLAHQYYVYIGNISKLPSACVQSLSKHLGVLSHPLSLQLQQAESTEEVQRILGTRDFSFQFDCGFAKPDRWELLNYTSSIVL